MDPFNGRVRVIGERLGNVLLLAENQDNFGQPNAPLPGGKSSLAGQAC